MPRCLIAGKDKIVYKGEKTKEELWEKDYFQNTYKDICNINEDLEEEKPIYYSNIGDECLEKDFQNAYAYKDICNISWTNINSQMD